MQTISTKYYGINNTKGRRIKAETSSGVKLWESYDPTASSVENHMRAAKLLKEKLKWNQPMIGGETKTGMVFVFDEGYII